MRLAHVFPFSWLRILGCAISVTLSSCASLPVTTQDLLVKDGARLAAVENLSPEQVQRDIDVLLYALQIGYGGRKFVDQAAFQKSLDALRQLKAHATELTSTELLCEAIDRILLDIPDNHLHARTPRGLSKIREAREKRGSVGINVLMGQKKAWGMKRLKVRGRMVPVLSITELPHAEDTAWNGFWAAVEAALSAPVLILDVRGNSGGSDVIPQQLAARLSGKPATSPYEAVIKSETAATFALAANSATLKMIRHRERGESIPPYLTNIREKYESLLKQAEAGRLPEESAQPFAEFAEFAEDKAQQGSSHGQGKNPYSGVVLLLQDSDCASSCESLLEYMEGIPRIITVGENSAGSVHFGNVGVLLLPHSNVIVQIATDFWKYRDGRFVEKTGYAPDIRAPEGTDALRLVRKLLEKSDSPLRLESRLPRDRSFLRANEAWLRIRFAALRSYFGETSNDLLTIQVMPVEANPSSRSCARTYGSSRIYAHSPESLRSLPGGKRHAYEAACFGRYYEDLKFTLIHEYVHALSLRRSKQPPPRWLWEGAAVALSGQLVRTKMGKLAPPSAPLRDDLCRSGVVGGDPYLAGGSVLRSLEASRPGVIRELLRNSSSPQAIRRFLREKTNLCAAETAARR